MKYFPDVPSVFSVALSHSALFEERAKKAAAAGLPPSAAAAAAAAALAREAAPAEVQVTVAVLGHQGRRGWRWLEVLRFGEGSEVGNSGNV